MYLLPVRWLARFKDGGLANQFLMAMMEQRITLQALSAITQDDLKDLIPQIGTRVLFTRCWRTWKNEFSPVVDITNNIQTFSGLDLPNLQLDLELPNYQRDSSDYILMTVKDPEVEKENTSIVPILEPQNELHIDFEEVYKDHTNNLFTFFPIAKIKILDLLKKRKSKDTFCQELICLAEITIPVLNFGMVMGWQSPMTPILQREDGPAPEPITDETISWMASVTFFPPIFCGFLVGDLADRLGRKITTMLTSLMLVISWSIMLFSLAPWALIASRAVAGLACAGCYVVTPLYLKEIASDNIRGALGSLFILSQNAGYLVVYVAGDLMSFASVMWLCTAIPVIHLLAFLPMPETPVFLVKQGKLKEARTALAWLRNTSTDDKDLEEAVQQLEREEEYARSMKKATWMSIIKDKTTFKAFRISVNVMLSQETCGYLVVLMYAGSIFDHASKSIGLTLSPNKQTIIVGAIQLLGSIVASCIVEQTGRKWLLAGTSLATGLSMLALGGWFYLTSLEYWLPGWLPVVAMCLCIFADAAGYQPVPYVITSELFSFQHRGMVNSFVSSLDALSDFLQTKAYDPLLKLLGIHWVFIMFSVVCFLGTFYTVMWVPETKNRSVEEIYALLEDGRQKEKRKDLESGKEVSRL